MIVQILQALLKPALPEVHATRFKALMAAVEAGLSGASVAITALGRAVSGPAYIKHKIKRMDRLIGNPHLGGERFAFYKAMTQWLLHALPMPLILIDWSPLTDDQTQQLLRAALPVGGRSITLYEEVHPGAKLGNRKVQHPFLERLQQMLPPAVTPIIVADSGFRTPFFRAVERLGWHWLGRIRNRDFVAFDERPDDWLPAKSLYAKATRKPKLLGAARWVRSHPLAGQLVAFWRPPKGRKQLTLLKQPAQSRHSRKQAAREKEPWLLVVSPSLQAYSPARVVAYYRSRMQIDACPERSRREGFRDTKATHYGLNLADESRIQTERRPNLLLIAALIIFALWIVGINLKGTEIERHIKVNSGPKSPYSVIFLGRIACQQVVFTLPPHYVQWAQAMLESYFETLETG
ncbi:MAG: IS4 family transposase [Gammaproteobacteria bacterium]